MKNLKKLLLMGSIVAIWGIRSHLIFGQVSAGFSTLSPAEEAVAAVERQRMAAQVAQDFTALESILGSDLIYCHSSGSVDTKDSFLKSMRDGKLKYIQLNIEEMKVRLYGKTAIITGICATKVVSNGQEITMRLKYTDAYVKRKKQWQLVTWQSLRMPN